MSILTKGKNFLECQNANERIKIIAWGENGFRVVSTPNGEIDLTCSALLPLESKAIVNIEGEIATIQNGKIKAIIDSSNLGRWNEYLLTKLGLHTVDYQPKHNVLV